MITRNMVKKAVAFLLAICVLFISFVNCKNNYVSAVPSTDGIMFGQCYRLRNAKANLYLTMNSTSDADNVGCSLQARNANNSAQIFRLGIYNSTNTYNLSPLSSSNRVLSLENTSNANNVSIVLKSNSASSSQAWYINMTTQGYMIKSYLNGKTITPKSLGSARGTAIGSYSYSTSYSDWQLEPAYEGMASYFVTTTLSQKNSDTVNRIKGKISSSGYDCNKVDLPVPGNIMMAIPESRMTVLHGHGRPGCMQLDQTNGKIMYLYSEKPTNNSIAFSFSTRRNSYIMLITCQGATASSTRESLVDAAYSKGARCVTGYKNNVAGGEDYFEKMMNYIQKFPDMTLYYAMKNADGEYTADQRKVESCPANSSNRYTLGNPNFAINLY